MRLTYTMDHVRGRVRILLDGKDVTNLCRMADDESGEVELLKLKDGQPYIADGEDPNQWHWGGPEPATEILRGHVQIERVSW